MLLFWGEIDYIETNYLEAEWSAAISGTGDGKLNKNYLVGLEGLSDKTLVSLERSPEYSVERWDISSSSPSFTGKSVRGHGDADDKFNNPQDITVDNDDWVYVLDILSNGQPRIKVFDQDMLPVQGFGDSTTILGTARRIDWDKHNNALHVLSSTSVAVFPK